MCVCVCVRARARARAPMRVRGCLGPDMTYTGGSVFKAGNSSTCVCACV